jgi:hypothetical protein
MRLWGWLLRLSAEVGHGGKFAFECKVMLKPSGNSSSWQASFVRLQAGFLGRGGFDFGEVIQQMIP